VAFNIKAKPNKRSLNTREFKLGAQTMPTVESALHLGIIRTTSLKDNMIKNVEENIKKARRSAYGLFGGGYHGNNGLDPDTLIHLFKMYITPVLLYGMELIIPKATPLIQLELFQKRMLKQLLSLPTRTADAAVYVLSGLLPVEAQIHIRTLVLFNNICNQADNSIEKNLARKQLIVKSNESSSWFIEIKYILRKYILQEASWYLDNSPKKSVWTSTVKRKIYEHWSKSITESISYYKSLQYLSCENLEKGKLHPILKINCKSKVDLHRLPIKLKLLTGAYILQSNRIKMYKNELNTLCLQCEKDRETTEHFILDCEQLKEVREPIIQEINSLEQLQIELEKIIRKCTTSATTGYNSINQKSEIKPSQCSKN
jgi:hypothetical protein